MPLLYETATATRPSDTTIIAKISRPLTTQEKLALLKNKWLMEQKANVKIYGITITAKEIRFHCSPAKGFFVISMSVITAIAIIAGAIGLPITAWFLTQPPAPGPLGLPQLFWVGLGLGIPIIGLVILLKWRS